MIFVQVISIFLVPILLFRLEKVKSWFKPIVMSYVFGIFIGNLWPSLFEVGLAHEVTGVSIVLAIPLMLFSTNFTKLIRQPKILLLSYLLAVVATTISVFVGYWMFKDSLENIALVSGMLEGVYTGGTVNLNAIAYSFQASEELIILMNGFDWSFSGIYLLLIFTVLPKALGYILPKTEIVEGGSELKEGKGFNQLDLNDQIVSILKGVGLSVVLLGVMAGFTFFFYGRMDEMVLIFGITGLALVLSNIKPVRELKGNMVAADYLMMVFGFTLGLQANVYEIFSDKSELFSYFMMTYSLMLVIHLLLAKLFKVDVHSFLISSSAAVFGPPFIGPIAESLKNRSLIAPGIIVALVGNAMGTYLGILIVKLLLEYMKV